MQNEHRDDGAQNSDYTDELAWELIDSLQQNQSGLLPVQTDFWPKLDRQRPLIQVLQDAWNLSAVPRVSVVIVRRSVQLPPEACLSLTVKTDSERIAS